MLFPSTARRAALCAALALATFSAVRALASDGLDTGDTAWILSATALVLFMTLPGLAMFYANLVQSKNIFSVLMHHFTIACLMSVLWVVAGYSLAFSGDGAWFGFNGGSAFGAGGSAGMALLVTHIAAAKALLVWMGIELMRFGRPSLVGIVTGMVAGLATVTPASGFIGVPDGLILSLAGGFGCYIAVDIIRGKLKIDDSLDVFAAHGVGGIIGSLLVAFLELPGFGGIGLADGVSTGSQFMAQLASVSITIAWTLVVSAIILMITRAVTGLRVDEQTEVDGLDLAEHGERGYPGN